MNDRVIKLHTTGNVTPKFCKARFPPFSLRDKIEDELNRLVANDVIEKVDTSEWATPIVPVLKSDKSIRICGDFKITVNKVLAREQYPIPRIEELTAKLSGSSGTPV